MNLEAPLRAVDRFQRPRAWISVPIAVTKRFGDSEAGKLAATIAYYGFFARRLLPAGPPSTPMYGTFAMVIGLLRWIYLGAQLAVLNVVLHDRLWPRSLEGELTSADRRALRRSDARRSANTRSRWTSRSSRHEEGKKDGDAWVG